MDINEYMSETIKHTRVYVDAISEATRDYISRINNIADEHGKNKAETLRYGLVLASVYLPLNSEGDANE